MGVSVQGYTDVCVTHDILQGFRIHTGFCHIRAKGVPAYMRGNFRHLDTVNFIVFLNDMLQILLPMKGNHRHPILILSLKLMRNMNLHLCKINIIYGKSYKL